MKLIIPMLFVSTKMISSPCGEKSYKGSKQEIKETNVPPSFATELGELLMIFALHFLELLHKNYAKIHYKMRIHNKIPYVWSTKFKSAKKILHKRCL